MIKIMINFIVQYF